MVNIDKLEVKIHKLYANNIVYLLNNMRSYSIPSDLGIDVFEKEIETRAPLNEKKQFPIDLRSLLPEGSRGLFFLTVNEPDGYYWSIAEKVDRIIPQDGLDFALDVAKKVGRYVNFFVLDVARTEDNNWILIEINDGCMSGLSECNCYELYRNRTFMSTGES